MLKITHFHLEKNKNSYCKMEKQYPIVIKF